ncbi:YpiF family protein [Texcoconibacillus texcoconensis]|uniref:DUF2487 domain-containing protein n=1 Tax=Texcoconibacillus texcoconensis TaxID=1095777 RepID=A0A840QNG0_9BACI|nr:YpiF family protein [Texcoconibacillus texcoconensis]MBB5172873.1 hypothetical protein [Texcoconibacillus texcoconensis]
MKWTMQDIDTYLQAKEYVDTAVIPLIPIDLKEDVKQKVSMGTFISTMADAIERQFKGRVLLFPAFTYIKNQPLEKRKSELIDWDRHVYEQGFKHVVYLTADGDWKQVEDELPDMLVWLPALPFENMEDRYLKQMIDQQMKQIIPLLTNKWQSEPKQRP